ncbi:MAG: 4-amino-4-deoxychorismate lyase [Chthoniobacter sp.]|nr:4-amino-4-deoxychorismate lyase [Chthoniobacter sp.]
MSVFESILVRNDRPVFLTEHLDRLRSACATCGFVVAGEALENCGALMNEDGLSRVYVTAGDGSVTGDTDQCGIYVFNEPRPGIPSRVYHRGYDVGISPTLHQQLFNGVKTGNYWSNLDAFRRGIARQQNETLLFNASGELISACMANVFVVQAGRILTPPATCGARSGVVRQWIFTREKVEEKALKKSDLLACDEIFLTSSWLGVMPVAFLEGKPMKLNAISRELRRSFEEAIGTVTPHEK